jgi:uncharacterized coiled-coil DUF342 family protein
MGCFGCVPVCPGCNGVGDGPYDKVPPKATLSPHPYLQRWDKQIVDLKAENKQFREQVVALLEGSQADVDEIKQLRTDYNKLNDNYTVALVERNNLRAEAARLHAEIAQLSDHLEDKRVEIASWRPERNSLVEEKLLNEARADNARLTAALQEIEFHGGPAAAIARQALEPKL